MAKLTLTDLTNLQNESSAVSAVNANSALIETALENTLSRDGTAPNTMGATLDMNSNRIINLPQPVSAGEALRLGDVTSDIASVFTGDSGSGGVKGLVPAPAAGYAATGRYLDADGTWTVVNGTDVSFTQSGAGATTRNVTIKNRERISVKDFGATGDGTTDDTAAINAAITAAAGKTLYVPTGTYKITSSVSVAGLYFSVIGDGLGSSIFLANTNFAEVFSFAATAAEVLFEKLSIVTTGTTTRCVTLINGSQVIKFRDMQFTGNGAISLVYSQASGYCTFDQCRWDCNGSSTVGLVLDMYNQNTRVFGGSRFGGIGNGMLITKSSSGDRVEGACIINVQFIVTGTYSLNIGSSLLTQVIACNLDQALTYGITLESAADDVLIEGNWIGLQAGSTGICINYTNANGGGNVISGNSLYGGTTGISVGATVALRLSSLNITNNKFANHSNQSLALDSVGDCRITGNVDVGTPASGSWYTTGTHASKGSYYFDNNKWHTTAPALFDTASTYRFGSDRGIVTRNNGTATVGNAATTVVVNHGLSRTPSKVVVSPKYTTSLGSFFTSSYTSTQFTITWVTATVDTNAVWVWEAEV